MTIPEFAFGAVIVLFINLLAVAAMFGAMRSDIRGLRGDVKEVKEAVGGLSTRVNENEADIARMQGFQAAASRAKGAGI